MKRDLRSALISLVDRRTTVVVLTIGLLTILAHKGIEASACITTIGTIVTILIGGNALQRAALGFAKAGKKTAVKNEGSPQ